MGKDQDHTFRSSLRNTPPRGKVGTGTPGSGMSVQLSSSQKKQVPVWNSGGSRAGGTGSGGGPRQQYPSAPSSGTRSVTSQRSQESGDSTRFSVKEFKAVTGGTPGTAPAPMLKPGYGQQGIAYENKILTPDGFDASQTRTSAEDLAQESPDTLLSAQLLRGANWQDVLREALASSDNAAIYDDHGELNDEERIEAEAMYNEAHVAGGGGAGEGELDELDAELVDRIRGVKDQAEGRAVHLMELLGRVHETQIKKQAATPTPAKGHRPRGLPPMPGTTSSQKRRTMRTGHSPIHGRVTYSDVMAKGNGSVIQGTPAAEQEQEQEQDVSVLSSPTMSHNFTPQSLTEPPSQQQGSQTGSPPRSPPREVPLHKAHTTSSSVKASPHVPHDSLITGNTSSGPGYGPGPGYGTAPPTPAPDQRPTMPFRPTGLGTNGSFISSSSPSNPRYGSSGTPGSTGGGVRAYAREQEQAMKLQALSHRVDHMTEQIARLERAVLLVLEKYPFTPHDSMQLRAKMALYDAVAAAKRFFRALLQTLLTTVSIVALYVVFLRGLKLTLFAATTYPLPIEYTDPVTGALEAFMGASWQAWDEYTLPRRLLQAYQLSLYPHFGYLGLCSAQAWLAQAWSEGAGMGECLLPLPDPTSSAPSKATGWFA